MDELDKVVTLKLSESDCGRIVSYLNLIRYMYKKTVLVSRSAYDKKPYIRDIEEIDLLVERVSHSARQDVMAGKFS